MRNEDKNLLRKIALGLTAVTELFLLSISGFALGYFLDKWLNLSTPWLSLIFAFLGLVAGFFRVYQIYIRDLNNGNK